MQQVFKYRDYSFIYPFISGITLILMVIGELKKESPSIIFLGLYIIILLIAIILIIIRTRRKYIFIDDNNLTINKETYNFNEIRGIDINEDDISIYLYNKPFISINKKYMDSTSWKEFHTAVEQYKNTLTQTDKE